MLLSNVHSGYYWTECFDIVEKSDSYFERFEKQLAENAIPLEKRRDIFVMTFTFRVTINPSLSLLLNALDFVEQITK